MGAVLQWWPQQRHAGLVGTHLLLASSRWLWRNDGQSRISRGHAPKVMGGFATVGSTDPIAIPFLSHLVTAKSAPERLTVTDSKGGEGGP